MVIPLLIPREMPPLDLEKQRTILAVGIRVREYGSGLKYCNSLKIAMVHLGRHYAAIIR